MNSQTPSPPSVSRFLRKVLRHGANTYSVISLFLALAAPFLPVEALFRTALASVFALISFLVASYRAWSEVETKLRPSAGLRPEIRSSSFGSSSTQHGLPRGPCRLVINLELVNEGLQPLAVTAIRIASFHANNELIGELDPSIQLSCTNHPHGNSAISLPHKVPSSDRELGIRLQAAVPIQETEPLRFASLLGTLETYEVGVEIEYEDLTSKPVVVTAEGRGTFSGFKKGFLLQWKKSQMTDRIWEYAGLSEEL